MHSTCRPAGTARLATVPACKQAIHGISPAPQHGQEGALARSEQWN
jgi:hypothetical protein